MVPHPDPQQGEQQGPTLPEQGCCAIVAAEEGTKKRLKEKPRKKETANSS
jgi:hypothetical protein